jgi:ethanolamine ammonia-lyase large subunit
MGSVDRRPDRTQQKNTIGAEGQHAQLARLQPNHHFDPQHTALVAQSDQTTPD